MPKTHSKERLLPDGESSIIFNLEDERIRIYDAQDLSRFNSYGTALFSGARSSCFAIDTKAEERVVGVEFRGVAPSRSFVHQLQRPKTATWTLLTFGQDGRLTSVNGFWHRRAFRQCSAVWSAAFSSNWFDLLNCIPLWPMHSNNFAVRLTQ